MQRRSFLAAAATLAMPSLARAASATTLRFVPDADLVSLDPVWTTSYQSRDHGFLVYDTLFGLDAAYRPVPQMLEGAATEADGKVWKLTLREGLLFHDNEKVRAADCVASIRRWGRRDTFGQALMAATDELAAADDRTIVVRLKRPFPLLPDALAKASPSMCPIMPARLAETDAFTQVSEAIGSGPYRLLAAERVSGAHVAYQRFAGYRPRPEPAQRTAGGKVAHFERIEWKIMSDTETVASALQRGEVDWWGTAPADLVPLLRTKADLAVSVLVPTGLIATMRFNHLQAPFNNPAIRRALLGAVNQADYMMAVMGEDRRTWRDGVGYFCPGSPMANDAGMSALTSPRNLDAARRALSEAGYDGDRVVLLGPMDIPSTKALALVTADLLKKLGVNLDFQAMDWATVVQRRTKTESVDKGGWSIFQTSWAGLDQFNPAGHVFLRGNGRDAAPGWPIAPRIEALRDQWLQAPDLATQKLVAERMQEQAFVDVPYIPLGQVIASTAARADLSGMLEGQPLFWNIRRG
jgi:peptide/nickel transport system substrate-binding protein